MHLLFGSNDIDGGMHPFGCCLVFWISGSKCASRQLLRLACGTGLRMLYVLLLLSQLRVHDLDLALQSAKTAESEAFVNVEKLSHRIR